MDKVILLLDNNLMNDNNYLSKLISMGIYNFANNKETLMYLYNHQNTYKDVAHIHQLGNGSNSEENSDGKRRGFFDNSFKSNEIVRTAKVLGFKNVTTSAGATTLIYMLKKVLSEKDYVVAIEVNKNDFGFFNEKDMYSVSEANLSAAINKFGTANMVLVDLNNVNGDMCDEIVYLIEPSTIKLNKMMLVNKDVFDKLSGKKIVLNKSSLSPKDVNDFEYESRSKVAFNIPPLNDRSDNKEILTEFINKLEL